MRQTILHYCSYRFYTTAPRKRGFFDWTFYQHYYIVGMIRKILIHSYLQLINNSKLTKLTLFTLFAHSLIFVVVLIYNAYFYIENEFNLNTSNEVIHYIFNLFSFDHITWAVLLIGLFLFFWYFVFGPIGECAIVHYLHHNHRLSNSLSFGFTQFHHIAKFEWMVFMFNIIVFINILSKLFVYQINNGLVTILMVLRFLIVSLVTLFFQFTKTIIIVEKIGVFDAIKKSFTLSFESFSTTSKLVGISLLFGVRALFNVLFIIGIPVAVIVLLQLLWVVWTVADVVVYTIFFWLVLFLAYINTLIEWYFRVFRYLWYLYIIWNTEQLAKLGVVSSPHRWWLFDHINNHTHDNELELLELG